MRELYPTIAGGREWFLPPTAALPDAEWVPDQPGTVTATAEPGVFHSAGAGASAEVRLSVHSPAGKAWWRDVELTFYTRKTASIGACEEHWELEVRGERHGGGKVPFQSINDGVRAPPGTTTWPWYAVTGPDTLVPGGCLGTTYHGNLHALTGRSLFEKEISHVDGYCGPRGSVHPQAWPEPTGRWLGYKLVVRNRASSVHLELWIDVDASGAWVERGVYDDVPGTWEAVTRTLNGCAAAPYGYARDQLLGWAGPWITFRSDCMAIDFRWLSAREIGPLD